MNDDQGNASVPQAPAGKVRWQRPNSGTKEERANHLVNECQELHQQLSGDVTRTLGLASALTGRNRANYRMPVQANLTPSSELDAGPDEADENLIYEIFDATLSSAASSPLIPTPQGRGAMFKLGRALRHATRWLGAAWEDLGGEAACLKMFADAFQHSWGAVRVRYDKYARQVAYEPVRFDELLVSQSASALGAPPARYLFRKLPGGVLTDLVGLEEKPGDDGKVPDGIMAEAWYLPKGGQPGRHMLVYGSGQNVKVEVDEEWKEPWDPIVVFHWRRHRFGFFDVGAAEQLLPYHNQLVNLNQRIRTALIICTTPRLLAHVSAQIQVSNLDSEAGRIFSYKGAAPTPLVWPTNLQEMLAERERTKDRAYESFGTSQMTSTQSLPPSMRVDSSAAVREVKLMEDQRKLDLWTRFQDSRMELGKKTLQVQGKYGDDQELRFLKGKPGRWDKVAPLLDPKAAQLWTLKPLPATDDSLAAKRATIEEMLGNGLLSDQDRKYLAGHPDPDVILARARARIDDIDRVVEELEEGTLPVPEQIQDLEYGLYAVAAALMQLRGAIDYKEHLDVEVNMLAWMNNAKNILDAEAEAQMKKQMQQAMMAQAAQPAATGPGSGAQPVGPTMAPLTPGQ